MELFADVVPKTAENVRQLFTGEYRYLAWGGNIAVCCQVSKLGVCAAQNVHVYNYIHLCNLLGNAIPARQLANAQAEPAACGVQGMWLSQNHQRLYDTRG